MTRFYLASTFLTPYPGLAWDVLCAALWPPPWQIPWGMSGKVRWGDAVAYGVFR